MVHESGLNTDNLSWIKPRKLEPMPRCTCTSPDPIRPDGARFRHPAHPGKPCWVTVQGEPCPCDVKE